MKLKYSLLSLPLLLGLMSCHSDSRTTEVVTEHIAFKSGTGEFDEAATRVSQSGDMWYCEDEIGTYMVETGTSNVIDGSVNLCYACADEGSSVLFTHAVSSHIYPEDGTKVDFIAYYPYSNSTRDFLYPIRLSDQTGGSAAHDLMYARSRSGYSTISDTKVTMTFAHQLAKVVFRFINNSSQTVYPSNVSICGMHAVASFDLISAEITAANYVNDINAYFNPTTKDFEAVIMPCDITTNHTAKCLVDGTTFTWEFSNTNIDLTSLETGYKYTFTIPLNTDSTGGEGGGGGGGTSGSAEVEIDGGNSTTPWQDGGSVDGNATKQAYSLFPLNEAAAAYADTELKLTFDSAPTLGTTGKVQIYKADGTLVDEIDMSDRQTQLASAGGVLNSKMNILGVTTSDNGGRLRVVNYNPLIVEGNSVIIRPHYAKLDYNTSYYVIVDKAVINHTDFSGFTTSSQWAFTTKSAPSLATDNTVTAGHEGTNSDFYTVQAAIDYLCSNVAKNSLKTVYIYDGVYEELLYLRGSNNITFKGQSREGVIIRYDNSDGFNGGVGGSVAIDQAAASGTAFDKGGGRGLMLIESSDKIRFETLTMENTHVKVGNGDQAEVIYFNSNNAIAFVDCNFKSCQDTFNLKGYPWFYNCLVAGDVDFIWGSPLAALFENCEIRSVADGYIFQARCAENAVGFVLLNCNLTTTGAATYMYLARTAGNSSYFDNITFANCKMASVFSTTGWGLSGGHSGTAPNPSVPTLANGYKLYNTMDLNGNTVTVSTNYAAAYTLSDAEFQANFSSRSIILNGYDSAGAVWFAE